MVAWSGISLLMFNSISHLFAALTCELSSWTLEEKFHISARPRVILYVFELRSETKFEVCDPQWIPDSQKGWIPIFFFLLDSGSQSLAGFRIPQPRILDFKSEKFVDS